MATNPVPRSCESARTQAGPEGVVSADIAAKKRDLRNALIVVVAYWLALGAFAVWVLS